MSLETRHKILGFCAIAIGALGLSAAAAHVGMGRMIERFHEVADVKYAGLAALDRIESAHQLAARAVNALQVEHGLPDLRARSYPRIERAFKEIDEGRAAFERLPATNEIREVYARIDAPYRAWRQDIDEYVRMAKERDARVAAGVPVDGPELRAFHERMYAKWQKSTKSERDLSPVLGELATANARAVEDAKRSATAAAAWSQRLQLATLAIAAALLAGCATFLIQGIRRATDALSSEAEKVRSAVAVGQLSVRADPARIPAEFRGSIEVLNGTMDAFCRPIQVTAEYVERIARGDLPPRITDPYEGDFNLIKQNLNTCIDAVDALITDATALSAAAVEGRLESRADAARHQGDYRKIVEGVNETLDAVVNPIHEAAQVLEQLARRDLQVRVRGDYRGDHAKIKEALNATAEALQESMVQVAEAVRQVSSASSQIASSSEAVASGASEQASSLQETSAALESMAAMTRNAAEHAQQANALAQSAQAAALDGSAAMEQMTGAMAKIKASAEGTSQIIKDINEIAFQTNLLALNAAVEAARAGEAGRGFAVVAEEVRSLALRSKDAANKTEELIRQSVKQAGEGAVTARQVGAKLGEIAGSITKVSGIVAEIAATSKEQTVGIDQVTGAVSQMSQLTQQNAASSEESSSAAAELSAQSEELAAMVGTFRLHAAPGNARAKLAEVTAPPGAPAPSRWAGGHAPPRSEARAP